MDEPQFGNDERFSFGPDMTSCYTASVESFMKLPKLFGPYLLHHRVAQSESSEVFVGQTLGEFPRLCVVKRVRPEISTLPDFDGRFRHEAALLLRLVHGNVVQVLEVGAVDGQPFVAMEHLDGIDLRELIDDVRQCGPLGPEVALYVGIEMCEAVSYICQRRREHARSPLPFDQAWPLDLMISFDGVVKIISPGSVGALRIGQRAAAHVLRSPGYATPEVLLRNPLDARSDVFSVGIVLWEMLAGQPLVAQSPEAYVRSIMTGSWRAPLVTRKDVPGEFIRTLAKMLEPDPDKRLISPEAVRAQLVTVLRRIAPAFGSGQMAQLLLSRYAKRIGVAEELTDRLMRRAVTIQSHETEASPGQTLTYGREATSERPLRKPAEFKPGDPIPGTRYRMVRRLGRGGSADVFAAQHIDLDRQVAIKILAPDLARQQSAINYFRLEARTCSRIGHPNIIEVIDFGELTDGRFFFAMELLQGCSLGELLTRERRLEPQRAIPIFRQIAKALQAAHEHGVIHRDLKPENVMLVQKDGRDDFVKVLDFGVMAFATDEAAERVGTPGYMAPEQLTRTRPTPATDVYAMGSTLYESLCGRLPYDGETLEDYHKQQSAGPPPALRSRRHGSDVPAALERVVHRALERAPANRHPSAADFEADLLRAQAETGLETTWDDLPAPQLLRDAREDQRPSPREQPSTKPTVRLPARSTFAVAGALTGLVLIIALLFGAEIWQTAPRQPAERTTSGPTRSAGQTRSASAPADSVLLSPALTAPERASLAEAKQPRSVNARPRPNDNEAASAGTEKEEMAEAGGQPVAKVGAPRIARQTRAVETPGPATPRQPPSHRNDDSGSLLLREARTMLEQRHLEEARRRFDLALKRDPSRAEAALGLAAVAFQRARYDEAARFAQRAVRLDRRLTAAHLMLGDAYAKLMRKSDALASWRRALSLDPENAVALARISRDR
jgi:serine/threonine protein kinase